jgi:DegV family protein with EDD domain
MLRILTDSSTGFTLEEAKKFNVEMTYMPIMFEDGDYLDALTITNEDFYKKLSTSKTMPKTSLITQSVFEEIFEDVKKKGDEMIVLPISSGLSATYESAVKAQKEVGCDKIYVLDSKQTIAGLILLVMEAVKLREQKMKAADVVAAISAIIPKVETYGYFDTLKYLRAGGRISGVQAVVGTMLGVKPIVQIMADGKLENKHKCIGLKKAQAFILSRMKEKGFDNSFPVYFTHAQAANECSIVSERAKKEYGITHGGNFFISATVGTHTGPGAVVISFVKK